MDWVAGSVGEVPQSGDNGRWDDLAASRCYRGGSKHAASTHTTWGQKEALKREANEEGNGAEQATGKEGGEEDGMNGREGESIGK